MARFSFSKKFNTEKLFNIETENFEYMSLEDLANATASSEETPVFIIRGVFVSLLSSSVNQSVLLLNIFS